MQYSFLGWTASQVFNPQSLKYSHGSGERISRKEEKRKREIVTKFQSAKENQHDLHGGFKIKDSNDKLWSTHLQATEEHFWIKAGMKDYYYENI